MSQSGGKIRIILQKYMYIVGYVVEKINILNYTEAKMKDLSDSYSDNVRYFDSTLNVLENFDIIKKTLKVGADELTFYYIDGFIKDAVMSKLMIYLLSLKCLPNSDDERCESAACRFCRESMPYVESDTESSCDACISMLLSGAALLLGSTFGGEGVIVDARTYPARDTSEPEGDKVMRGARDGFVEALIFNTALIRRRIRDPALTMKHLSVGKSSRSDVVICYMKGRADVKYVKDLEDKIKSINTDSLTLGHESLAECLIRKKWYNPFPKIRYTERPDSATAQLLEGSVLVICDNSPEVMVLPTSVFDFMQETNDFYFSPLTGTYIRVLRHVIFWLTLFMIPLWLLLLKEPHLIPPWLAFIIPKETGRLPILAQILLAEFIIDALRMASLNTPNMLSNSLSVVGGLILGDFAVSIGWFIPEVILYMAFIAIANFTQRSYELGYAFKFLRILLTCLTALFGMWGFLSGSLAVIILLATNKTVGGERGYLYPLIPFNGRALLSLFVRVKKYDVYPADKKNSSHERMHHSEKCTDFQNTADSAHASRKEKDDAQDT